MAELKIIEKENKRKNKSNDELLNELLTISFNQSFFNNSSKRKKYHELKEDLDNAENNLEYKENILERSESYKMSTKNKIENMEDQINEKREKLLKELGSSL